MLVQYVAHNNEGYYTDGIVTYYIFYILWKYAKLGEINTQVCLKIWL